MVRRKKSQIVIDRNKAILKQIGGIKCDHPAWGYRFKVYQKLFVDLLGSTTKGFRRS